MRREKRDENEQMNAQQEEREDGGWEERGREGAKKTSERSAFKKKKDVQSGGEWRWWSEGGFGELGRSGV